MFEGNQRNTCVEEDVHAKILLQHSVKKIGEPSAIVLIIHLSNYFYLFVCFYVLAAGHVGS